jgi:putative endonuclease
MKYVYLLESIEHPEQNYVGLTDDLRARLKVHNSGGSSHTTKYKPWQLITYVALPMSLSPTKRKQSHLSAI